MKFQPLLFSLVCAAGCDRCGCTDEPVVPPPVDPAAVEPVPPPVDPVVEALGKLDAGITDGVLAVLEPALAAKPDDAGLWYAVEVCALASGKPGEMLDRLSVTEAIGKQALQHHALRATLALASQRLPDALDAANALRGVDPGAFAAFRAWALQAGATLDTGALDPAQPMDALVLLAGERDEKKARKLLETAVQVSGWRPALVRAEVLAGFHDTAGALVELDKLNAETDVRASLAGTRARLQLMDDPHAEAALALEASRKALGAHDGGLSATFMADAVDQLLRQGRADDAANAVNTAIAALPEGPGPVRLRLTAIGLDADLAAGAVKAAIDEATEALASQDPGDQAPALARGLARAAWRICDATALATAIGGLPPEEADAVQGMVALCAGDQIPAREKLAAKAITGPLGVDLALAGAWAWFGQEESIAAAQRAVAAADALGWRTTRIEAGLTLERQARVAGKPEAAAAALAALEPDAGPNLQAELFARRLTQGQAATAPTAVPGEQAIVAAWRSLAGAIPATAGGTATGIMAWAEARQALAAGSSAAAATAFKRAMPALPVQQQGRWAPLLALDGADGPALDGDIEAALALTGRGGEDALLALHEFAHFRDFKRMAATVGYDWTLGLDPTAATAWRLAHAAEDARTLMWLAGSASFPTEARDAAKAALPALGCLHGMAAPATIADVRRDYPETALFSMRLGASSGEMLLVTPASLLVKRFEKPQLLRDLVQSYLAALNAGPAFGGPTTDPRAGDRFRREVIDSVVGELVGIARYLVVADPALLRLPWSVLPEQIEGRRYLADIRTVAAMPYLGSFQAPTAPPESGYKPDFFGLTREELPGIEQMSAQELALTDDVTRTMLEAGLKPQGETTSIARLFGGGYSLIQQGAEVTKASFEANYPTARYLHLAGIPAGPACGFAWADGASSLPALACTPSAARMAVLSTGPSPEVQLVRAQALREAGVASVLVAMWNPPPILRSRYLTSVYDALNRERAPARALAEARESLVATLGSDGGQADPSYWGAFLYVGAP